MNTIESQNVRTNNETKDINPKKLKHMSTLRKLSINIDTALDSRISSNAFRIFCLLDAEPLRIKLDIESICVYIHAQLGLDDPIIRKSIRQLQRAGYLIFS